VNKPFIAINCAAIPENLLESELFGHEKGAFTGALAQRIGKFEQCDGGTLFLDEIGDMPMTTQTKILRVLQEGEISRVGSNASIKTDVRIIAATNKDLWQAVQRKEFREDLFYRLNVVPINLPPLRLRGDDLTDLIDFYVAHFARKHGKNVTGVNPESMERLKNYRWPGNVRELQNTLERAVIMSTTEGAIEVPDFALADKPGIFSNISVNDSLPTVDEMERRLIGYMLLQTNHNKTRAAEKLEISLRTLRNKLRTYREMGFDTDKPETWVEAPTPPNYKAPVEQEA
jgi:transcriptional regulator with PAS, ATPase and Fis domain